MTQTILSYRLPVLCIFVTIPNDVSAVRLPTAPGSSSAIVALERIGGRWRKRYRKKNTQFRPRIKCQYHTGKDEEGGHEKSGQAEYQFHFFIKKTPNVDRRYYGVHLCLC